ncbi:MAG: hypothetical protein HY906_25370 [Deltaproteobacteria bacterium]|nr:hypothetical protein [Deltaproteobacteria bacterium]
MTMNASRIRKVSGTVGAAVGFVAFLIVGLLPAVLYGGWTGLVIAGAFFGHPVNMTVGPKILIGGGAVLGVLAVGALFTVIGSVLGSLTGGAIEVVQRGMSHPAPAEAKADNDTDGTH